MNVRYLSLIGAASAWMVAGLVTAPPVLRAEEASEDVQVLTRGPVHEAFAEAVSDQPEAGLVVNVQPPEPIEELPPEEQPEGKNVVWIPGYWGWDDEREDFIWISGVWRNLPPGRQWVPGYWSDIGGGKYQWTSGYWADEASDEVDYVATAPPASIDEGPNIAAPSDDYSWIPGNWVWTETRYVWRPGYWLPLRQDWTWVPSRYYWTPRGYVYVDGYWDYAVGYRGMIFAPVYFSHRVYRSPGYYYTPSIVIALDVFVDHLFIRPRYHHYYFGDYYAPRYRDVGFYPPYYWHHRRHCYDPIYAYDRWYHRGERGWDDRRRERYEYFRDHENHRPPHTWAAMRDYRDLYQDRKDDRPRWGDRDGRGDRKGMFAEPLTTLAKDPGESKRLRRVDKEQREQLVVQTKEMRKFGRDRQQLETREVKKDDRTALREKFNKSPIAGISPDKLEGRDAPPKRPERRGGQITGIDGKDRVKGDRGIDGNDRIKGDTDTTGRGRIKGDGENVGKDDRIKGGIDTTGKGRVKGDGENVGKDNRIKDDSDTTGRGRIKGDGENVGKDDRIKGDIDTTGKGRVKGEGENVGKDRVKGDGDNVGKDRIKGDIDTGDKGKKNEGTKDNNPTIRRGTTMEPDRVRQRDKEPEVRPRKEVPQVERPVTPKVERPVAPKVERPVTPKVERPVTPKVERQPESKGDKEGKKKDRGGNALTMSEPRTAAESQRSYQPQALRESPPPRVERSAEVQRTYQPPVERNYQPKAERTYQPPVERNPQPKAERAYQPPVERTYQPQVQRNVERNVERTYQPPVQRNMERPSQPPVQREMRQSPPPQQFRQAPQRGDQSGGGQSETNDRKKRKGFGDG